jgi:hypothetical protein
LSSERRKIFFNVDLSNTDILISDA